MWTWVKKTVGDYADRWTQEQIEGFVRHWMSTGGGGLVGAGIVTSNWWVVLSGILPVAAAFLWSWAAKLNDDLPQP